MNIIELEQRLRQVEDRLAILEGKGFTCVGCHQAKPLDWYWYTLQPEGENEIKGPFCGKCIRCHTKGTKQGPFKQPVKFA